MLKTMLFKTSALRLLQLEFVLFTFSTRLTMITCFLKVFYCYFDTKTLFCQTFSLLRELHAPSFNCTGTWEIFTAIFDDYTVAVLQFCPISIHDCLNSLLSPLSISHITGYSLNYPSTSSRYCFF